MPEDWSSSQWEPLLKTKLFLPRVRPGNVPRPRLFALLDQGMNTRVTLLSAPAGSGKSTLLSAWAATEQGRRIDLAWLSLEEADSDPHRFWLYVAHALERLQPGVAGAVLPLLTGPQQAPVETVVRLLVNQLAEWPREAILALDDYHAIQSEAVHQSVALFVEHLPPQVRLVIATRVDPPLPLTRWRARGELSEVRLKEMRFTPDEAGEFLTGAMGLTLTPEQVAILEKRTEGWVAGLQLAGLSLQGLADVDRFVAAFAGSHQYILDYLLEEVLHQQAPEVQSFLLKTSVLDRLSGPLCDGVTGEGNGQAILEALERQNLFVIALDQQRQWYRYHHLFAEVLRARLSQTRPAELPALHGQACRWYEENGLVEPAVNHALAAGDPDRAASLIAAVADSIWHRGDSGLLVRWVEALPDHLVRAHPDLGISIGWALMTSGRIDLAESFLQSAEERLTAQPEQNGQTLGKVLAVRAHVARLQRNLPASVAFSQRATAVLPPEEHAWRGLTLFNLGAVYQWTGQFPAALETYAEAKRLMRAAGDLYGLLRVTAWHCEVLAETGGLVEAMSEAQAALAQALEEGGERLPVGAIAHFGLGRMQLERYDLASAEEHLLKAVELSLAGGLLDVTWLAYLPLAITKQAQGDSRAALHYLEMADQLTPRVPWALAMGVATRVRILLAQGEQEQAYRLAPQLEALVKGQAYPMQQAARSLAAIKVQQSFPEEALALLTALPEGGVDSIRFHGLMAMAHRAAGNQALALEHLGHALELGAPTGSILPFVELGRAGAELLTLALPTCTGAVQAHARRLPDLLSGTAAPPKRRPVDLVDPPSERELEVLALLAEGASNEVIAQRLFITLHTAKKHVANLLGKLGAANRTQAVARGRELGLLD